MSIVFTTPARPWITYILSDQGLPTLLVILTIALKLLINRQVTMLHLKKMLVSFPGELTFLVLGFLLSSMISESKTSNNRSNMALIVVALIALIIQYAIERYLDDKLSGRVKFGRLIGILLMYVMSICLYVKVVFGG